MEETPWIAGRDLARLFGVDDVVRNGGDLRRAFGHGPKRVEWTYRSQNFSSG